MVKPEIVAKEGKTNKLLCVTLNDTKSFLLKQPNTQIQ